MVNLHSFFRLLAYTGTCVALLLISLPDTAAAQEVKVPASFHRQEHPLSCEIATLKMALDVHGISVPESELLSHLPFDSTPKLSGIWGDPNTGFVGNIDGRMLVNGYGVYWNPIAALGRKYTSTSVMKHGSPTELARAITAGNPVIIWGYYGKRAVYSWQTLTGKTIHAMNGEHTRLVYGFDGPVSAPTRFYLIDPIFGHMSWSTQELMHNWSSFQHMGVVVTKHPQWVRIPGDTKVWEIDYDKNIRRWVTTWATFVNRGGSTNAISSIDQASLSKYTTGTPILF